MSPNSIPNLKLLHLVTSNPALLIELFYHASPKFYSFPYGHQYSVDSTHKQLVKADGLAIYLGMS